MNLNSLIKDKHLDFIDLCRNHQVRRIYAFGSSVTDHFDSTKSDIDVVVELSIEDPIEYGETLISLWDSLEVFFDRKVDLLTEESINNPYLKKNIELTKKLIYDDGQGKKILV